MCGALLAVWQVSIHFSKDAAAEGLSSWQRDVGAHVRTATGGLDSPHEQLSAGGDVTGDGEYGPCVAILGRGEDIRDDHIVWRQDGELVVAVAGLVENLGTLPPLLPPPPQLLPRASR